MRSALALFLVAPLAVLSAPRRSPTLDETFTVLERAWSAADQKHDLPAIERLLAEEFVGIDGRGVVSNRADELNEARERPAGVAPPTMEILAEQITDVQAR